MPGSRARRRPGGLRAGSRSQREQEWFDRATHNVGTLPSDPVRLGARMASDPRWMSVLVMAGWTSARRGCAAQPDLLPDLAWSTLAGLPAVDAALCALGGDWSLHPDPHTRDDWLGQLRWAGDSVANIARLCRAGLVFGGVVLARTQLERWTANVAHLHRIEQKQDETSIDWIGRAWASYGDEARATAIRSWTLLSEWQHGRGIMPAACDTTWIGPGRAPGTVPPDLAAVLDQIWECTELAFRQARGAVWVVANRPDLLAVDDPDDPRLVNPELPDPPGSQFEALQAVWSLPSYAESPGFADTLAAMDGTFTYTPLADTIVADGQAYRQFIGSGGGRRTVARGIVQALSEAAVRERRARAIETARLSFAEEAALVGDRFNPSDVNARLFRFIAIAQATRLVARWVAVPAEASALTMAAAALDSAWTLWLEDTDQAMGCVRALLEHTAVARCWRTRPDAAQQLADRHATPARWIERAGWKRLSVLNQTLSEFAHLSIRSHWHRARVSLIELHDPDDEEPVATVRGGILEATAYLLAQEVLIRLAAADTRLAEVFRTKVTLLEVDDHAAMLEGLLERSLAARQRATAAPGA